MSQHNKLLPGQRRGRYVLIVLLGLLALNLLLTGLRAAYGPVKGWFAEGETQRAVGQPVDGVASLELLREQNAVQGSTQPETLAPNALCLFISVPQPSAEPQAPTLQSLQQRLLAVGIESRIAEAPVETERKHVLYLDGVHESQLQEKMRWALAQDFDAFVLALEDGRKVVAIGLFDTELQVEQASRHYGDSQLTLGLGLYTEQRAQPFLVIGPKEKSLLSARLWRELAADFDGLQRAEKYCNVVAPQG